jgi:HAD superfamily hydrolase (TIGR01509 family)
MTIKHIVLDLGGVLIELEWRQNIAALFGEQFSLAQAQHCWSNSSLVQAHETGSLDLDQFVSAWCEQLQLDSHEAAKAAFLSLLGLLKPHTESMLAAVGERFDLSMLSNISHAHIQHLDERVDLKRQFSRRFLSCDLGKMKPVADVYQLVVSELQSDAAEIAFFDDVRINVDAAIASGWQAWRVESPQEIMKIIATQEIFR